MSQNKFTFQFNQLPPSVNNYLKPSARIVGGRPVGYFYESSEAKSFKMAFGNYLKREVRKKGWDIEQTKEGLWYLDLIFVQSRVNEDNNNYYKILCDSMSGICIDDDKNILVRTQRVFYDSENPYFKGILHKADYIGIFTNESDKNDFIENNCIGCSRLKRNCSILRKATEGRIQGEIVNKICLKSKVEKQ